MDGGFFLTVNTSFAGAMGQGTEVAFMGYDANTKLYTYEQRGRTRVGHRQRGRRYLDLDG